VQADSRKTDRVDRRGEIDAERLRRLQALTDAALAHLELDELLAALLLRTREALEVDTCAVLLLDVERSELVARAAVGIEEEVEQGVRIPLGGGFAGKVAAGRQPIVLPDVDHADVLNPILREKGIKSLLGVPLLVGGEAIGVLHVGTLHPRDFGPDDIDLLQLVGDRAAIAIEHARLFEAERFMRRRMENLQAVSDAALAHLDLDELLSVLLPRIRDILRTDTCAILLLDRNRRELVARAALGIEEEVEQGVRIPIGRGFAGKVAAERAPVFLPDVDQADIFNPILREKGIKSMLGVPLLLAGEAIGVLHVGTLQPRVFTSDDTELLELVATRVALAVQRATLHEEVVLLDQLKLNFVAVASHELRTPAAAVYGALATLFGRDDLTADVREQLLLTAFEQSNRLRRLLEQLLDLSQLDARTIVTSPRPLALRVALSEIVSASVPPEAEVRIDVSDELAAVIDPLVLDRVVSNLLTNAVRYGAPPVVIEAAQRDRHLHIAVTDHGTGVPEELAAQIFERFTRTEGTPGTGLGLAIAKAYARALGGDLVYQPADSGARFELIVPSA
jgi:signal transduction histidine kinase